MKMGRRAPIKALPSQEELERLFSYNPATGVLTWKARPGVQGFKSAGRTAGTVSEAGYVVIGINKTYYQAHRLIWKIMTGSDPEGQVDHIDGNRLNNRWVNFRAADNGTNVCNSKIRNDNKSGIKGVCWDNGHKAWRAYIGVDGKSIKLGRFKNIDEAARVVMAARERLHGEFARFN